MAASSSQDWRTLDLPIVDALPGLLAALRTDRNVVLEAPPGAGKTTIVPLALLDQPWAEGGKILMLEPRRIAARAAARRMAGLLGEDVGQTVGYRMRLDRRVSARTRIEVVTEGMLVRQLQQDLELAGVRAVIFDEFHERSLDADLGLALAREVQDAFRDDLRVLVMSATLDGDAVARLLDAPVIRAEGRMFPVKTHYLGPSEPRDLIGNTVRAIGQALREEDGSLLVFLPGVGELRRVARALEDGGLPRGVDLHPLYGDLSATAQDAAIAPAPDGRRKIVLATAIAETSLTIDGVRVVIDAGRMRKPSFDPASGMTRLQTLKVSAASAEQRRGRAGRVAPGVCYRLWSEAEQTGLVPASPPEIESADLAPLALELSLWGAADPATLAWMTPPPAGAFAQARALLRELGATDDAGRITAHGREMAAVPAHPRLAHMTIKARSDGLEREAALITAILSERDILRPTPGHPDSNLKTRLRLVREGRLPKRSPVLAAARQILGDAKADFGVIDVHAAGRLLALAYPDRIAMARMTMAAGGRSEDDVRYLLSNGRGAVLDAADPLASARFLAVATLGGPRREGRIFLAAPLTRNDIDELFAEFIHTEAEVRWNSRSRAVVARRVTRFEALELEAAPLSNPAPEALGAAVLDGIREIGLGALPWTPEAETLRARVALCRRHDVTGGPWPDLSDAALLATLEDWLAPFLGGVTRADDFRRVDLLAALRAQLNWTAQQALDRLAPTHVQVPSGSRIRLDYLTGDVPVLAARLQEMFGMEDTPRIMDGRVAVLVHLLSPARRPLQVTQDLAGFWRGSYAEVKAEMKGRYPKHYWPDNPLEAEATARVRPKAPRKEK